MIVELERTDLFFPHNTVIRSLDRACKDWRLGKGIDWWGGWGGKREGEDDGENFRSGAGCFHPAKILNWAQERVRASGNNILFQRFVLRTECHVIQCVHTRVRFAQFHT